MENRKVFPIFMLIALWYTTHLQGQNSFQQTPVFASVNNGAFQLQHSVATHPIQLHLKDDQMDPGLRLRRTGRTLFFTGLAVTAVSTALFYTSYQIIFNPDNPHNDEIRLTNSLILIGFTAGATTTLAGTVVWTIGKVKQKKNPGE